MPNSHMSTRGFRVLLLLSACVLAAGCSADVARFDMPAGFSGGHQTNSIVPPANVYGSPPRAGLLGDADGASHQPPPTASEYGARGGDVRVAELPPASGGYDDAPRAYDAGPRNDDRGDYRTPAPRSYDNGAASRDYPGYSNVATKPYDAAPRHKPAGQYETAAYSKPAGETIEVRPGDTLYGLSRQHGVPVSEIMAANDLKGHSLKPGQRLTLPAGHSARGTAAPATIADAPAAPAATEVAATADAPGTYTMKPGDSLYAIARQHKVKYADLQKHNGITDDNVRKIRPGTVLKIPGAGESLAQDTTTAAAQPSEKVAAAETVSTAPASSTASEPVTSSPSASAAGAEGTSSATGGAPKVLNASPPVASSAPGSAPPAAPAEGDKQVAALEPAAKSDATPAATESKPATEAKAGGSGRLRWPVQGRVISTFGPRPDGTHNDGVNLSVPLGTDVHAAEGGEVIYVGDELKAYGKLVLLRHDNGWVTAYAHNEELLVTRGKKVARGDVIAKAGKTGPVDQPQVHFELRQESKAVDPTSFMEPL